MTIHHKGLHHITVLAGDPRQNADFYVRTLGMRLVKKSVNQDDPGTYHLFYGNPSASPGSSLTFFPWPRAKKAVPGIGEATAVSFIVPEDSVTFWEDRFEKEEVPHGKPFERFGHTVLPFEDPDGLSLELVFRDTGISFDASWEGTVGEPHLIRGFWGTTLRLTEEESTAAVLEEILGFRKTHAQANISLYETDADIGNAVIIELEEGTGRSGTGGRGTIHHVAFRTENEEELHTLRREVANMGLSPTRIIDRHWFKSVYFQTPGGVLFEMATEGPGYTVDEDPEHLGEKLVLPPWLESRRELIEERLPEIGI